MPFKATVNRDVKENVVGGICKTAFVMQFQSKEFFKASTFYGQVYGEVTFTFYRDSVLIYQGVIQPIESRDIDAPDGYEYTELSAECGLAYLEQLQYPIQRQRKKVIEILDLCISQIPQDITYDYRYLDGTFAKKGWHFTDADDFIQSIDLEDVAARKDAWLIEDSVFDGMDCLAVVKAIISPLCRINLLSKWCYVVNDAQFSQRDFTGSEYTEGLTVVNPYEVTRDVTSIGERIKGDFQLLYSRSKIKVRRNKTRPTAINPNWDFNIGGFNWNFSDFGALTFEITDGYLWNKNIAHTSLTPEFINNVESEIITYQPYNGDRKPFEYANGFQFRMKIKAGTNITGFPFQVISEQFDGGGDLVFRHILSENGWFTMLDLDDDYEFQPFITLKNENKEEYTITLPTPPPLLRATWDADVDVPSKFKRVAGKNRGYWHPIDNFSWGAAPSDTNTGAGEMYKSGLDELSNAFVNIKIRVLHPFKNNRTPSGVFPQNHYFGVYYDYIRAEVTPSKPETDLNVTCDKEYKSSAPKDAIGALEIEIGAGYPCYPYGGDSFFEDTDTNSQEIRYFDNWDDPSGNTYFTLEQYYAKEIMAVMAGRLYSYNGQIFDTLNINDLIEVDSNPHRMQNVETDYRRCISTVKTVALTWIDPDLIERTIKPTEDAKIIQNVIVNNPESIGVATIYPDENIIVSSSDGGDSVTINPDFTVEKITTLQSVFKNDENEFIITENLEIATEDFTQIRQAKSGTIALISDIGETIDSTAWKLDGNTGVTTPKKLSIDIDENIEVEIFGNTIATFTPEGNFAVGTDTPLAVIHAHANVSGASDVVLLRATNVDVAYFFSVAVNPVANEIRLYNSSTLKVKNSWKFDTRPKTVSAVASDDIPNLGQVTALVSAMGYGFTWIDYITGYSSPPEYLETTAEGEIWLYYYNEDTELRYRRLPAIGYTDAFFTTFVSPDLSDLVVTKIITI